MVAWVVGSGAAICIGDHSDPIFSVVDRGAISIVGSGSVASIRSNEGVVNIAAVQNGVDVPSIMLDQMSCHVLWVTIGIVPVVESSSISILLDCVNAINRVLATEHHIPTVISPSPSVKGSCIDKLLLATISPNNTKASNKQQQLHQSLLLLVGLW